MPENLGNERPTAQTPLIAYAQQIGWSYLSQEEALNLRRGESGTLLYSVLQDRLLILNPGIVNQENVQEIINNIEGVRSSIEGNAEVMAWLRGERTIYVDKEKQRRNVAVIDFEHPSNNVFQVTDEWQYTNGQKTNRADVVFLINGVPVAVVETKSSRKNLDEGLIQVRRYHEQTPELMTAPQVFNLTNVLWFDYGVTWSLDRKNIFEWKEVDRENFERKVKRFFARESFLKILQDWIIFFKRDDELKKAILRQHQTRAVEKVVERCLDPIKKTGLIWHTQGSGKTFTMISAVQKILSNRLFEKPTVLMLVDRNELEGQLAGWVASVLGERKAELVLNKKHLRELLKQDYRGLIVSMIHKFEKADANLCTRENVFVLVDEAHRSTGGDLGNYLIAALPNATFVGFSGTPIDKIAYGKGTFKVFGKDDPQGYLDKYSVAESIEDGTTLELHYALAPNDIRVPREQLEKEFFALTEAEGISDIEELNRILDKAVNLKAFLKSKQRIQKVADFVASHFKNNVEPLGYKAFLVGVDREACALYKKELDKRLPKEYSAVVYTSAHNDSSLLEEFRLSEDDEKKVRRSFLKKEVLPKILIVTEKLLTGYDAPILYCMYLDKPMRDHTLLQAIARVNRPYEEMRIEDNQEKRIIKPAGFVLDFVGIFEKLEKALAFDSDVVGSVIKNIDTLKTTFETLMKGPAKEYLTLCKPPINDKSVEHAVESLSDKAKRENFYAFFKDIERLYEIISPDIFLRPYIDDYRNLSLLYAIIRNKFSPRPIGYSDLMKKTESIVREKAEAYGFVTATPFVRIDSQTLDALKKKQEPGSTKVINMVKTLVQIVQTEGQGQPFLIPIGERAEKVMELYDDRQMTTQDAISELETLMAKFVKAREEMTQSGFDVKKFSVYWVLKQANAPDSEKTVEEIEILFKKYPNYADNVDELRQLKAELYRVLLPSAGKERMISLVDSLLRLKQ